MNRKYIQILSGIYDEAGRVRAKDAITGDWYSMEDRPDIKQRIEKSINSKTHLAIFKRGTRNGFEFVDEPKSKKIINKLQKNSGLVIKKIVVKNDIKTQLENSYMLKPDDFIISDLKWKFLIRNILKGKNIMVLGHAGSGKTQAAFLASKALKREVFYFNLGATQDPRSTLIGNIHYEKDTGTHFCDSLFVRAIQQENAVILLDELSRAHPEAWNILMTVLDPLQRYLRIDEKQDTPTIKVANGVSFISTANVGNEYTATRVLDRALIDRFSGGILEMELLNESEEKELLHLKFPKVDLDSISKIAKIVTITRKEVESSTPKINTIISTRTSLEITELISEGFTLSEAAEMLIFPLYPTEGGVESERTYIRQVVQKFLNSKIDEDLFNIDSISKMFD